jgi:hypothetical protein
MSAQLPHRMREVEDEIHFLCSCPSYSKLRDEYLNKEKTNLVKILSDENLFFYLLTAEGNIAKSLSKFCFYVFQERNKR